MAGAGYADLGMNPKGDVNLYSIKHGQNIQ